MRRWKLLLVAAVLCAGGCAKPVLDATDLDGSIARVRKSLDASQRGAFDSAVDLVRSAASGQVHGTKPFSLNGMSAAEVLAEAERIGIRNDRALEEESAAAHRDLLAADEKLSHLWVTSFIAEPIGDTKMEADVTVRNELDFPVETAWLAIEVALPGGAAVSGEEFVSFQPALRKGEQRMAHILVLGSEARALPVEPPATLRTRFVMVERGGEVALKSPTPEERQKFEAAIVASEKRIRELDARLAAVKVPGS